MSVKEKVLYALDQGILHPMTPEQYRVVANIIGELAKLKLVDEQAAMRLIST